nr:pyridoxine 5'-phosphate synthase [Tanacetum cinerariifolium]
MSYGSSSGSLYQVNLLETLHKEGRHQDEAKRAREQAKVLEEARDRRESQGIKVVVDKDLHDDAVAESTWVAPLEDAYTPLHVEISIPLTQLNFKATSFSKSTSGKRTEKRQFWSKNEEGEIQLIRKDTILANIPIRTSGKQDPNLDREVHHEVHVRTKVHRYVEEEEVRPRAFNEEDVRPRVALEQIVKEQEQKINGNGFENVPVGGLDHRSMEGVSQCMSVDHLDKNDESESVAANGLNLLVSQDVDRISKKYAVVDDHDSKVKDNEESYHYDSFISTQKDVGISDSMTVDQTSLGNNILGDVHVGSVVKDGDETDVKTVVVPF